MAFYTRELEEKKKKEEATPRKTFWQSVQEAPMGILQAGAEMNKAAGDIAAPVIEGAVEAYNRTGTGLGELAYDITGGNETERKRREETDKNDKELIQKLGARIKEEKDETKKAALRASLASAVEGMDAQFETDRARDEELLDRTDPMKNAAAMASVGLDIVTAGAGGAVIKGGKAAMTAGKLATKSDDIVKTGLKIAPGGPAAAVKRLDEAMMDSGAARAINAATNPTTVKEAVAGGAGLGAAYGGLGEVQENGSEATLEGAATGAATGAVAGAAFGGIISGIAKAVAGRKGSQAVTQIDEVKAAETPFARLVATLPEDVQGRLATAVSENRDLAAATITMDEKQATDLITMVETKNAERAAAATGAPEPEVVGVTPDAPAQTAPLAPNQLDAAAMSDNPAEYARSMNADVTPGAPTLSMEVPRTPNRTMAAEVTPGQTNDTLVDIEDVLTPEERAAAALNGGRAPSAGPRQQEGARTNWNDGVDADVQESLGLNELDDAIVKSIPNEVSQSKTDKFNQATGRYLDSSIERATRTGGKVAGDTAQLVVKGSKIKADMMNEVRPTIEKIQKLGKEVTGGSVTAKTEVGKLINRSIESGEDLGESITDPKTKELYTNITKALDDMKKKMVENGIPVQENYSPWRIMKDYNDSPDYLARSFTDKSSDPTSNFAKKRERQTRPEVSDENIIDMLPQYMESMANHISFTPAQRFFEDNVANVPAAVRGNKANWNDSLNYLNTLIDNATSVKSKGAIQRGIQTVSSNVYKNVLFGNPKNAAFATVQRVLSDANVTSEARSLKKELSKEDLAEIDAQSWFGDKTYSGEPEEGVNRAQEILNKVDINQKGESLSVRTPFRNGYAQGITDSAAYKDAVESGLSKAEAFKAAHNNPEAREQAIRAGNIEVNNTAFGANSMARPETFRDSSALGKAFKMFMRFPMGTTNYIKDTIRIKDARALDVLMKGDPRAVPISEMRTHYKAIQSGLEDVQKAVKKGKAPEGITQESIDAQLSLVKENVDTIDKKLKEYSHLRAGRRTAALATMWAATAAIQMAWDGFQSKDSTYGESLAKTDPTVVSSIIPGTDNSKAGGLSSPISPVSKYGFSERAALNLLPGVGAANRIAGYANQAMGGESGAPISDYIKKLRTGE